MKIEQTIMCVDAGFRHTGVAIWSESKKQFLKSYHIQTEDYGLHYVADNNREAIQHIAESLRTIRKRHHAKLVIAEMPVGSSKSARAAACMAMAFSTLVTFCVLSNIKLEMVNPLEVKRVVGSKERSVPKELVQDFVAKKYGTRILPKKKGSREHIADAMACLAAFEKRQ